MTEVDGIRVTTVPRTLLDIAASGSRPELGRAIDRAERLGLFDLVAVEELLARSRGRPGVRALREAIARWRPRDTRSELEELHYELLVAGALPIPQMNVRVDGEEASHEVDAVWPDHRLVVQLDGFEYHRTRRDRERDAASDADLELAGYRVMRLTWNDVTVHRSRTERRLRALLHRTRA